MTTPRARPTAAALALAALALAGCGDASRDRAWAGTVDTLPNGVVRVSNPEQGAWGDGDGWRLVEELRIGSAMDEGPAMFGQVAALEADQDGRIYVADNHAQEVRVFAPDGAHLFSFGRKGSGPGEFEMLSGLGWGPDGNLWVIDQRNSRFSVFDRAGTHLADHRRPGGFMMMPWPGGFDRDGRIYDIGMIRTPDGPGRTALVRYHRAADGDGIEPRDTFVVPHYEMEGFTVRDNEGRMRMMAAIPYAPGQQWRLADGHVWIAINDAYRLHRLSFDGDTLRTVERAFTPAPVTATEKDSVVAAMEWFTAQGGRVDRSRIPDRKPAFNTFVEDDLGYLWVVPWQARGADPVVDIFDPIGRYLGPITLPVPFGFGPRVLRGDRLYMVVRDDLDVPYVARFRIEGRSTDGRRAGE